MTKRYSPKLDPKRDLAGATPETLALALLGRRDPLQPIPLPRVESVAGDELTLGEGASHKLGDDFPHLVKGV